MSNIAQKIIDEKSYVVEFVTSVNQAKEAFFAYLLMPADYLQTFRQKLKTESLNLKEHGVVLASGMGNTPSQEVKDYILSKFPEANV
jgi:glucose-6-phosphate 1-dehydrogenase